MMDDILSALHVGTEAAPSSPFGLINNGRKGRRSASNLAVSMMTDGLTV